MRRHLAAWVSLVMLGWVIFHPPVEVSASTQIAQINPSDDAEIRQNQANATFNNGTLRVRSSDNQNSRSVLKFDLSVIPDGALIKAASLRLQMESAPGASRDYQLHYAQFDAWFESSVTWNNGPVPTSLLDSIATGTEDDVALYWGALGPNPLAEGLTSRVDAERFGVEANQLLTVIIKDSVESNSPQSRQATFTSKDTGTDNPIPVLIVEYELPQSCTEPTVYLEPFNLNGSEVVQLGEAVCFDVDFVVTAGCFDLSSVRSRGGIGGNLLVEVLDLSKGSVDVVALPGRGANHLLTWHILPEDGGLDAGDSATLSLRICTGTNPAGHQEFTSCGLQSITGSWSATAVVAEDGSIIESAQTDQLQVEVECP